MITRIGTFLRQLRTEKKEKLRDMAIKLGVSSAFLSAVENGKKKVPSSWTKKLSELYALSNEQIEELKESIVESSGVVEINIKNASKNSQRAAICFARKFETMDDEIAQRFIAYLESLMEE